jgi:hypothetical protein
MLSSPRLINRNHHPRKKIRSKSKAGDLRSTSYLRLGFPCFWSLTERVKFGSEASSSIPESVARRSLAR